MPPAFSDSLLSLSVLPVTEGFSGSTTRPAGGFVAAWPCSASLFALNGMPAASACVASAFATAGSALAPRFASARDGPLTVERLLVNAALPVDLLAPFEAAGDFALLRDDAGGLRVGM
jgi:hypothetical protein